jgi:hypothetical protein
MTSIVKIAAIEDDRRGQRISALRRMALESSSIRLQSECIGAAKCCFLGPAQKQIVAQPADGLAFPHRRVGLTLAGLESASTARRRLAHIVGVRLEGQAP